MNRIMLTWKPIDAAALLATVADEGCGATSLFVGTVRDVNDGRPVDGVEYSSYEAMAQAELGRIVAEAGERHRGIRIGVVHRLGELRIGDVSVAIACAHPHRAPALDACRYVIEQLKRRVPIWKREQYRDGTREWVDPTRPASEATA